MSDVLMLKGSLAAAADNATVIEYTTNAEGFDTWQLGSTAGAMDVFVSGDGTNFLSAPLALINLCSVDPATAVIETTANSHYGIRGRWKAIRVLQKGATPVENAYLIRYQQA